MTKETNNKIEREYVIPLRKQVKKVPRYKKANKAIRTIKEFLVRHMKVYDKDLNKIKVDKFLNEFVWFRGIKNPPHKVKVKAIKDGEFVRVELADMPEKLKFKKAKEENRDNKAQETVEKKKTMMQKAKETMQKTAETKTEEQKKEEKIEEKEKQASVIEAGKELEKEKAKEMKHTVKAKSPKQEKNLQKDYNKSSRGH